MLCFEKEEERGERRGERGDDRRSSELSFVEALNKGAGKMI